MCSEFEASPFGQAEWDAAVERLGGSVYMTWDWLRTWWAFYGRGCTLRLFWFEKDGEVVGLLPLYIQCVGPGPLGIRVARLVGANIPPKVFDPPMHPDFVASCLAMAWGRLQQECDVLSLGPVSEAREGWRRTITAPDEMGSPSPFKAAQAEVHTLFPLLPSYEQYVGALGKNEQKNRRKYELRLLRKEYPVRLVTWTQPGPELERAFERFINLHSRQWRAEGLPGHFGAWPRGAEYNRSLVAAHSTRGRVRIMELWAGEEHIGGQYAFAHGDRWYWELPARAPDERWSRFSLGPTVLMLLIAEAIREGCKWVEGGLGHYEYKLRLGAREYPVWVLRFAKRGAGPTARRLLARMIQGALRVGYHKLWYRRIQPRLSERWKRPQWSLWLHYDY
ncbi:GNAT family N-acetyltransferase [Limisphaera ngatamarikiensis]|uniref:GNAT family N-acetyltransferase n=1 Tax=Limisphaera ngatamarikiensis TaxID=1324935 RepID=A0A6M1RWV8_9BACT|nr:GNAT family N-acetyltransferase [Limisphaera ngatamarikiensis]